MKRACLLILALCAWTILAAALASQLIAGPQAGAFLSPETGQDGLATLRGNTRPEALVTNDRGRVVDDLPLNHLLLQMRRTPEREQALEQFIKDIHDPPSSLFHHWITAEEFGRAYGATPVAVAAATSWLESQGFRVNMVYPNQMIIDFSGSAGQIRYAFHTEIHQLRVKGADHFANMSDPQIPAELAAMVAGVVSLNDFRPRPMLQPHANFTVGDGGPLLVVPADLATIYNFNPAFAAGFSGQGQAIVVIEDSDFYTPADWDTFRSVMGLASAYPLGSLAQVHPPSGPTNNCMDPGANADDLEAAVDAEWASAGAPSAAIELASCASTETTWGGFVALQNLLNAGGAPPAIVSISYGESESFLGATFNAYINFLYQQAVAEGVSVFASSGDEGAARSDPEEPFAQDGINVSGFTSTPYNVSVGGTDFADTYQRNNSAYWNPANAAHYRSALSYVPEIPWNDSCASVLRADFLGVLPTYGANSLCNSFGLTTVAGGGGPSGCATGAPDVNGIVSGTCAGYAKPLWQSGFLGNPRDGVRDIPDVSLFASNGAWDHYYVVCISDPSYNSDCDGTPDTWFGAGGTSFSAPIMAGVQALINQASGARWGNPNPAYYTLAAEYGAGGATSCNSTLGNNAAASCVFYDVTPIPLLYTGAGTGGDIDVPCLGMNCYLPSGNYGVLSTAPQTLNYANVTSLGSGYTSAPSCTLSGGGGAGAACRATLTGQVSSLTLTNGGAGYVPAGTTCTLAGGGGTGARCALAIFETGEIYQIYLTDRGSGYTSAPACTIGGGGAGATCIAAEEVGPVVSLTAGGSGYTTAPHCALSGGGGTGATCAALALNTSNEYQPAFGAATGWDFATGIGTVNASNLVAGFLSYSATLSSLSLAFPPQALYTSSAAQSVTVTNTGTAKLGILGVGVGGTNPGDFAKTVDTCTGVPVAPLSSCTVSVTFTPAYVGNRSATLNFIGIAPRSSQAVALSGFGMGAGASLSPTSLTFPDQVAGSSATQTVTLTNPGNLPLSLTSIVITGNNRGDFVQTNTCGSTVAPAANCAIKVTFIPAALGSESAALTTTDKALDSPQTVSLAGSSANPVPFIYQPLVPTSVAPGVPGFTLTVVGTGFALGATVHWNGLAVATSYVSSEELKATVPAARITLPGTAWVTVFNPGSALVSNMIPFPVTAPVPTVAFSNASGSPIATGTTPMSVVTGDFNGDGKLDLAVANANASNVTILLGKGDGTFTPAASSPRTGCIPYAIAVGDFNGDGKLDLATANGGSDNVTILLGNGDGTLTPAAESPAAGSVPWALAVGDLNGDGKLDMAVANQFSNNVTILLGSGDGTFTPAAASPATGPQPTGIAVGDFNADGKLDLAVTNELGDNLTILLGNGDGTFTPAPASPLAGFDPRGLAVGDFNGDGKLDLAVANAGSNNVTILLGNGDGTFTPAAASPATGAEPLGVAVGDFNADGKLDLAVTNQNNQVTILLGNGDGTFTPAAASPATGALPWAVAVGDFKGDGRLDLAIANASSNNATIMLQLPPAQVVEVSPIGLTFPAEFVETSGSAQTVTLTNTGNASLAISSITASGDFSQTNTCGAAVSAGANCAISVTFKPLAAGTRTGALTISNNPNGSPQTVALSGTGLVFTVGPNPPVLAPSPPVGVQAQH